MNAPVCLFTYNRLDSTRRTVEALASNYLAKDTELFIFSDGAKNETAIAEVSAVREYLKTVSGFKRVELYESEINKGLADSIISGATRILESHGKVIVLEDDLVTQPNFLSFMNQSLNFYQNEPKVQSINGFSLKMNVYESDVYFQQRPFSWGWATWADRWDTTIFDKEKLTRIVEEDDTLLSKFQQACGFDIPKMLVDSLTGRNDSWYVRWAFNHFSNGTYSVYPYKSFVANIGFGEQGTHCKGINSYEYELIDPDSHTLRLVKFREPSLLLQKKFFNYFGHWHKIVIRCKYMTSISGQKLLIDELLTKLKIK